VSVLPLSAAVSSKKNFQLLLFQQPLVLMREAFVCTDGTREEEEEVDSWLLLTEDSDSNCTNSTATANNNSHKKMVFCDVD
jgi:hypothetical protein